MNLDESLIKLADKRVVLELENKEHLSQEDYLKKINGSVESLGYEITRVLQDVNSPTFYHIQIEKNSGL